MKTLLRDRHAYSMTFWAVFIGFVIFPLMALSIEVARYWFARGVGKVRDESPATGEISELTAYTIP